MPYKTILVHVDHSAHAPARTSLAVQLALEHDAHLTGAAMVGLSRYAYQDGEPDLASSLMAKHIDRLGERARADLVAFEAMAAAHGLKSAEGRLIDDDAQGALSIQARYADLVVVSQCDPDDPVARLCAGLPEYVLLSGARPLLVVPFAGSAALPRKALVAWNGSREAARALADALPLLVRCDQVTVALVNPEHTEGRDPGADIVLYLGRQGVRAEVVVRRTEGATGAALLSLAAERGCELLVMGGYGHARLREMLTGGVTETMLRSMTVPLLLSH